MNIVNGISVRPKILAVLHQETSSCGRLGMMLNQMGYDMDVRRPPMGDGLPETMDEHAGAVIFGHSAKAAEARALTGE